MLGNKPCPATASLNTMLTKSRRLDIAMPAPRGFAGNLTQAVANGTVSDARLSDMATRFVAGTLIRRS